MKTCCRCMAYLVFLHACFLAAFAAKANVYATNLRVNHSTNNAAISSHSPVEISYILNEDASGGVTLQILSDTNLVTAFEFSSGASGAMRGTNSVFWNGTDDDGDPVAEGLYSVTVTARSTGFSTWTQTTDDNNDGNFVFEPRGIAVYQNSNSPYYGRVFVGNAHASGAAMDKPGAKVGILKLNADGSCADEGVFSTGDYPWAGDFYSPWKIEVAADDKVYINDWNALTEGIIIAFDEEISTNHTIVLADSNWPKNGFADLSGPYVTGGGTNTQLWTADVSTNFGGSAGIVGFNVDTNGVVADGDTGFTAVSATNSDLDMAPYDVALDRAGNFYTIQRVTDLDSPENRVMRFPAFDGTNALTVADWKMGANDDTLINAYGIAVNPSGTYVAVAVRGYGGSGQFENGNVSIFNATNGNLVATFSDGTNSYTDVAWDKVGNLYATDEGSAVWRAFSPPDTNQATTVSVPLIQVYSEILPPQFTTPALNDTQDGLQFSLLGQSNVTYLIESTTDLLTWSPVSTNYSSTLTERPITIPLTNDVMFFRAAVRP
ncbi:MAG: FlgD immunoglobulin-like domain containing protein [Limisphaerales bacterium]